MNYGTNNLLRLICYTKSSKKLFKKSREKWKKGHRRTHSCIFLKKKGVPPFDCNEIGIRSRAKPDNKVIEVSFTNHHLDALDNNTYI